MESDGQPNELASQIDEMSRASRKRFLRRIVGGVVGCASVLFVTGLVMKAVRADAAEPPAAAISRSDPPKAALPAVAPATPPPAAPADVAPRAADAKPTVKAARPAAPSKTMATMKRGSALR